MGYRSKSAFKSGLLVYIATYPDLIADFIRTSSNDMTEKTRNSGNSLRKTALNPHRGASNFATQNCAPLPWPRIKPPAGPPLTCFGFMSLCKQACPVHKTKTRRSRLYPRPASWWAIQDSNLRPLPCQGNALTSCANRPSKWVPDSNRCIRLCRPLPSHSANPPMWF